MLTVDAKGQRLEFTYDAGNQLTQKVLKDAGGVVTDTVSFTYDPRGNLATAVDTDSGVTFTYDALGRLTSAQTAATVTQPVTSITYTYDKTGNRVTMTDPQAAVTSYVYDALNRLTSLTSPQGASTFSYDALGRRTAVTLPNGTRAAYAYDAASQLTELVNTAGASTLSRFAYTYDATGNRSTRTTLNGVSSYSYDGLNRLTQALQPDPVNPVQQLTESFAYDQVGNRTASHRATDQVSDAANRLLEDSTFVYTYDANGNLTSKTSRATGEVTTFTYNGENQLVGVSRPGLTAAYRYDALGGRIAKTVNGITTRYVYDQEDILVEYDEAGTPRVLYTHGPRIDEPIVRTELSTGQVVFYHADGLGTITELTDGTGAVVQRYAYEAFGVLAAATGAVVQSYTFTGREQDTEAGLYYYRARTYDPAIGRFLREDPVGFNGGDMNLYAYVNNNPLRFIDPFGLAYFAKRPLRGSPWLGPASCNPLDDFFNTEIAHEQLFFEDRKSPANIGFFDDGTLKEEPNPTGYRCRSRRYNDCIMRKAVRNAPLRPYCLLGKPGTPQFNCQDWAQEVRREYHRLENDPQVKSECECQKL